MSQLLVLLGFVLVLSVYVCVGLSARRWSRASTDDYLLTGRQTHPWLVGFAAAATNSSGFMLIGLIGATVQGGISAGWLMVGWIIGDYLAWLTIHRRLRERSGKLNVSSISEFVSSGPAGSLSIVRIASSVLIILFMGTYAAAQFTAGSKGAEVLLNWPKWLGVLVGFGILIGYCFSSGLRGSIWVNTVQSFIMMASVIMLLCVALVEIGGVSALWSALMSLDPKYVDWRPPDLRFGFLVWIIGWIAAGVGVIGQPHLVTITMTVDDSENVRRARRVYFMWYIVFSACCIGVGLCSRVLLNDMVTANFDSEMSLPQLATMLLPPVLVGIILGGLFAATLSTADTQIVCASAAVTQGLWPTLGRTYRGARLGLLTVSVLVALTALVGPPSVFELVLISWSCLAASLGPLMAAQALRWPLNDAIGSVMILSGLTTSLVWRYELDLSSSLYEVLPGMLVGFGTYGVARLLGYPVPVNPDGSFIAPAVREEAGKS